MSFLFIRDGGDLLLLSGRHRSGTIDMVLSLVQDGFETSAWVLRFLRLKESATAAGIVKGTEAGYTNMETDRSVSTEE